jgi:tryptophan-rich sensory protein
MGGFLSMCYGGKQCRFCIPLGEDNPWYKSLIEPSFAPPSWVFAPVWTILYLLIATSAYRIVTKTGTQQ